LPSAKSHLDAHAQIYLSSFSDNADSAVFKSSLSFKPSTNGHLLMFDIRALDELTQRLSALLPKDMQAVRADMEKNMKAVLQTGLGKLDLVTREEFDVQRAVLLRTREKLEALEAQLAALQAGPA
jgi:ubiquinone biosynthesis accessory factor UbiK